MDSLSLLTTNSRPHERLFTLSWATGCVLFLSTAQAAARIQAAYPDFWPEAVRALMVHSARWTQPMVDAYTPNGLRNQANMRQLLRHCGYGVPSLERALYSASNSLALIVRIDCSHTKVGSTIRTRDMHLHDLPWPTELLQALPGRCASDTSGHALVLRRAEPGLSAAMAQAYAYSVARARDSRCGVPQAGGFVRGRINADGGGRRARASLQPVWRQRAGWTV